MKEGFEFLEHTRRIEAHLRGTDVRFDAALVHILEDRFVAEMDRSLPAAASVELGQQSDVIAWAFDAQYVFMSRVLEVKRLVHWVYVVFEIPQGAKRLQRRKHARVEFQAAVTFTYQAPASEGDGTSIGEDVRVIATSTTLDLSAGGLRMKLQRCDPSRRPAVDTLGRVEFTLAPAEKPVEADAKVAWRRGDEESSSFEFAVEFLGLSTREQDRIFRYVFVHQANLRKRGLL